jgi:hypothetical protein
MRRPVGFALGLCILPLIGVGAAAAAQLISAQEASLPDDDVRTRGISRGPKIHLINPAANAGFVKSPFNLKIRFESFGGANIDSDSVLVTYEKIPRIDLTQRIRPSLRPTGINMENAEAPPGEHHILVEVKDSDGRTGWSEFTIRIAP